MTHGGAEAGAEPGPPPLMDRIARTIAICGGLFMLAAATMVTISVLLRWLLKSGIRGDFGDRPDRHRSGGLRLPAAVPDPRGNVFVDTFALSTPTWLNRGLDRLWDVVYAGFAF